jgi:Holliday junction resolvase RusA-like endonuclease
MPITPAQFEEMQARVKRLSKIYPAQILSVIDANMRVVITGQIRGGKNNMIVTRTGRHFPKPEWAKWRDAAVMQVKTQLTLGFKTFTEPVNMQLDYFHGDKRRRDMPAILDSIFHVLEKAGVVADDTLIWVGQSSRKYDKQNPRAILTFNLI